MTETPIPAILVVDEITYHEYPAYASVKLKCYGGASVDVILAHLPKDRVEEQYRLGDFFKLTGTLEPLSPEENQELQESVAEGRRLQQERFKKELLGSSAPS